MLSLDGTLRYVPMAALWDGESWLAEKYPTSVYTEFTGDTLRDVPENVPPRASALGVTEGRPGFPALTGVAEEISGIIRTGDSETASSGSGVLDGEALLDSEFTRSALSRSLSGSPVVHVASHFSLDPSSQENTVLLLGEGETLSLKEIRLAGDLDFNGLDLLTLSACDTASGARRSAGEGAEVQSLGIVVQRRGASAVLASLWPVADLSTSILMREFYRFCYVDGNDKAESLRKAQIAVMRDETAEPAPLRGTALSASGTSSSSAASGTEAPRWDGKGYSHPYYWAPFVVMGNWR
jgi:CHAT domain-containing protein